MNIQEFADMLNGREMGEEMISYEEEKAKGLGFVVVFGYSDDNAEFRGVIDEEVGCYEGATIYLDEKGFFEDCDCECSHSVLAREKCKTIEAIWHDGVDGEEAAWTYETDIPHATFEIMEDGEKYCRGIVFDVKSLSEV